MLLSRPERIGLETEEAIVLLEHRNLKEVYNRYLNTFIDFVQEMNDIKLEEAQMNTFKKLVKLYNETSDLKEFIKKMVYEYEPEINKYVTEMRKGTTKTLLNVDKHNPNRALFSEETTKKIMNKLQLTENLEN